MPASSRDQKSAITMRRSLELVFDLDGAGSWGPIGACS